MGRRELSLTVEDEVHGRSRTFRLPAAVDPTVGQFIDVLKGRFDWPSNAALELLLEGRGDAEPLDREARLRSALEAHGCDDEARLRARRGDGAMALGAAGQAASDHVVAVDPPPASADSPAGASTEAPVEASELARRLATLLESAPARFREKNRRVLRDVEQGGVDYAQLGPILLNWCHEDLDSFSREESQVLADVLARFIALAAEDPTDGAYTALLAASRVPELLPWSDEPFRARLEEVIRATRWHVRGGEGTAHVQSALQRLRSYELLPDSVRETVREALGVLWQGDASRAEDERIELVDSELSELSLSREEPLGAAATQAAAETSSSVTAVPHIALLIDLENLVYGLRDEYGDEALTLLVDFHALLRWVGGHGSVCLVNAYADWKYRIINQFQRPLYAAGVEIVHVLGRSRKNAADLRMAVDVMDMLWSHPHIDTYAIVSGDRDFIELIKKLRRRGKRVLGVANTHSVGRDFACLFDDFRGYREVLERYGRSEAMPYLSQGRRGGGDWRHGDWRHGGGRRVARSVAEAADRDTGESAGPQGAERGVSTDEGSAAGAVLRSAMREILAAVPEHGLKGARVKPLLRERLGADFHERTYGFTSVLALLRSMPDIVRIIPSPGGGDISICAADAPLPRTVSPPPASRASGADPRQRELIVGAKLSKYRFEPDPDRRRRILSALHRHLTARPTFCWADLQSRLAGSSGDLELTATVLSKYQTVLYQADMFRFEDVDELRPDTTLKRRPARLLPGLEDFEAFRRGYECAVVEKAQRQLRRPLSLDEVVCLWGHGGGGSPEVREEAREALRAAESRGCSEGPSSGAGSELAE